MIFDSKVIKGLLFTLTVLIGLSYAPSVLAQDTTPTPTPRSLQKRQEVKTQIEERKTERIAKLSAIRKERILNFSNKMIVRLEATIERIQKLIDRIGARITKIDEGDEDIDTEDIKESLDEAKEALALVKIDVVALKEDLAELPDSDDPKALFEEIRESLKGIKEDLKEIHGMLVKLIGDIKGLRNEK